MPLWLVVGVGNEFRGDDAVGCIAARELRGKVVGDVRVVEHQSDGTALLRLFDEAENIILIDAVISGKPTGTIHKLDLLTDAVPANFIHNSSHLFGIPEAVAIARELHQLPHRLIFYGIEGSRFDSGAPMSAGMEEAVEKVVARVQSEIKE